MQMNPFDLINAAFHHYSDATQEGRAAAPGNWNVLVNNYNISETTMMTAQEKRLAQQ
jgi:hypothetical protein